MNENPNPPLAPAALEANMNPSSPLDPLPEETPAAYEAFLFYFESPPPRSLRKAAQSFGGSENSFFEWSSKFHWQKRIQAYRVLLANRRMQADTSKIEQQPTPRAVADQQHTERASLLAGRLLDRSEGLLEEKLLKEGENISVRDILHMIHLGDQLGRPRRAYKSTTGGASANSGLRQELMAIAQLARENKSQPEIPNASLPTPATPEPSASQTLTALLSAPKGEDQR